MKTQKLPEFIIIGAGKCGTTSLHSYLSQHPQLYLCPKKETYFFINDTSRAQHRRWGAVETLAEYSALFQDAPDDRVIGEISTTYYRYPESAARIHQLLPEVKIIAILRDPAERAFSSYQMFVQHGHETADFATLITPDNHYVKAGFYYAELLPFFELFPRQHIKILLYDDLCRNPQGFLQELWHFLGVEAFVPEMGERKREGGLPKNKALYRLLTQPNGLRATVATLLKLILPAEQRQRLRSKLVRQTTQKVKLSPEMRQRLIELYRPDILQLQDLLERDLSAWLQP